MCDPVKQSYKKNYYQNRKLEFLKSNLNDLSTETHSVIDILHQLTRSAELLIESFENNRTEFTHVITYIENVLTVVCDFKDALQSESLEDAQKQAIEIDKPKSTIVDNSLRKDESESDTIATQEPLMKESCLATLLPDLSISNVEVSSTDEEKADTEIGINEDISLPDTSLCNNVQNSTSDQYNSSEWIVNCSSEKIPILPFDFVGYPQNHFLNFEEKLSSIPEFLRKSKDATDNNLKVESQCIGKTSFDNETEVHENSKSLPDGDDFNACIDSPRRFFSSMMLPSLLQAHVKRPVYFTHAISSCEFYCILESKHNQLTSLNNALGNFARNRPKLTYELKIGEILCGKFADKCWYRVKVVDQLSSAMYKVLFCDFGNTAVLDVDDLRAIDAIYLNEPFCAIHCTLKNLTAANDYHLAGFNRICSEKALKIYTWEEQARTEIQHMVVDLFDDFDNDIGVHLCKNGMALKTMNPIKMNVKSRGWGNLLD